MRYRYRGRNRRGAATVEAAITILTFLTLILGTSDLANAVFRQEIVSHAARQGARSAAVHGNLADSGWNGGPWGFATFGPVTAASSPTDPKVLAITPYLSGLDPSTVQITYEWPNSTNKTESPVRVTVSSTYTPIMLSIFGSTPISLSASSTMVIMH